jgi:tetratricopeptide (TPR) repeat protein
MKKLIILLGLLVSSNVFSQNQELIQNLELKVLKTQYDSAIVIANQILENDSSNWMVYYYSGKSYQAKYKFFEALKQYEKANELDSANSVIENALAGIYDFIGKDESAIQIYYSQYLRDTTKIEPIVNLANTFRKSREYGSAIHYYRKASEIDFENFYYHKQQAYCISKINMPLPAIYAYQIALMFNPYDLGVYQQLANLQNSEKYFIDAIKTCNDGLKNYPFNNQLMKIKAYAQYLSKDFDSSIVGFSRLLELGDTTYFNLKYLGFSYFEKKMYVNSIAYIEKAREFDDTDAEVCFFLGSAFGRSNSGKEGILYLYESLGIISPSPIQLSNIYSELAYIFRIQEKYELALDNLKLAYKSNASPILSFKMGQLYDYYLDNNKMALDCYEAYLTMSNVSDTLSGGNKINSFKADTRVVENAKERIRILNEDMFFESSKNK